LLQKTTYILPVTKAAYQKVDPDTGKKHWYVQGYASSDKIDRDGDRMGDSALKGMLDQIIGEPMTLFVDHDHTFTSGMGVITDGKIMENGLLWIEARLEDPEINPLTKLLLHKLEIGERIGLSIGGDLVSSHDEFDKMVNASIRVIDEVKLYEVSVVGLPANAESFLVGSVFKSLKDRALNKEIHSIFCKDGQCEIIFKEMKVKTVKEELAEMYIEIQKELDRRMLIKEVCALYEEVLRSSGVESPRETKNYIRIQQYPDEKLSGCSYNTKGASDGVRLVYCGKTLQTILFPKSKFDLAAAKEWATSHGYKVGTGELDPGHVAAKEEEDGRPPKDWFDRCVAGVESSGSADDPQAVCGNLWHNVMHEEAIPMNPMGHGSTAHEECEGCSEEEKQRKSKSK
jgi:HK97 family phage prohead protease